MLHSDQASFGYDLTSAVDRTPNGMSDSSSLPEPDEDEVSSEGSPS
jgi:hypothetical protein